MERKDSMRAVSTPHSSGSEASGDETEAGCPGEGLPSSPSKAELKQQKKAAKAEKKAAKARAVEAHRAHLRSTLSFAEAARPIRVVVLSPSGCPSDAEMPVSEFRVGGVPVRVSVRWVESFDDLEKPWLVDPEKTTYDSIPPPWPLLLLPFELGVVDDWSDSSSQVEQMGGIGAIGGLDWLQRLSQAQLSSTLGSPRPRPMELVGYGGSAQSAEQCRTSELGRRALQCGIPLMTCPGTGLKEALELAIERAARLAVSVFLHNLLHVPPQSYSNTVYMTATEMILRLLPPFRTDCVWDAETAPAVPEWAKEWMDVYLWLEIHALRKSLQKEDVGIDKFLQNEDYAGGLQDQLYAYRSLGKPRSEWLEMSAAAYLQWTPWYDLSRSEMQQIPRSKWTHKVIALGLPGYAMPGLSSWLDRSGKTTVLRCLSQDRTNMKVLEETDSELKSFKVASRHVCTQTTHRIKESNDASSIKAADVIWFFVGMDQLMDPAMHTDIALEFKRVRRLNHKSPLCLLLTKADLMAGPDHMAGKSLEYEEKVLYWRLTLLNVLELTVDRLPFDVHKFNRLVAKKPWLADPNNSLRAAALMELHHKCLYTPNWVICPVSCNPQGYDDKYNVQNMRYKFLEWSNVIRWDAESSNGQLRLQTIERRKASWQIQRLVYLASAPGALLEFVPTGLLRVIAKYAVQGYIHGYEGDFHDFSKATDPVRFERNYKPSNKIELSDAQRKLLKGGVNKARTTVSWVSKLIKDGADQVLDQILEQ